MVVFMIVCVLCMGTDLALCNILAYPGIVRGRRKGWIVLPFEAMELAGLAVHARAAACAAKMALRDGSSSLGVAIQLGGP